MFITVSDVMKLETLKCLKLISGQWGLNNVVEKVGILDYEFINNTEDQFGKGDFVISSFLFAKDDVNMLIKAIRSLIDAGVACLAIKDVYYKELPSEILEYSNSNSFPIFLFDNSIFFEDIITDITDTIRAVNNYQLLETRIDMMIKSDMSKAVIQDLALEINSSFRENNIVLYCKEIKYQDDLKIIRLLERLKRHKATSIHDSIFKYRNGVLAVFTYDNVEQRNIKNIIYNLLDIIGINTKDYFIGVSNFHSNLNELNKSINESLYALASGELSNKNLTFFDDIGIYKILMPFIDEYWVHDFYKKIILPLKIYDEKYNAEILHTAINYVENDGNIKKTSEALCQHGNTVRYRISKMKEILDMENLDGDFYEQLSISIKIYKILSKISHF